jgi:hypothetical protein
MPNLNQESTVMSSNDGSITLTTHRLLQRSRDINKEMMLTDFISYEQKGKRNSYYKVLTIIFSVAAVVFGVVYNNKVQESETLRGRFNMVLHSTFGDQMSINEQLQLYGGLTTLAAVLFGISLFLFLLSNRKYLRITGKFSSIEFSINNLRGESFSKFTNALITQSDNRKKE